MARTNARYGWIPDLPDQRDHLYAAPPPVLTALPPSCVLLSNGIVTAVLPLPATGKQRPC